MTSPTRALWLLTAVAMALLIGGAAAVSPAQIPAHLDASGTVTRWTTGSLAQWLAMPAIAAATVALVAWLSAILPQRPNLVNIPDKNRLLALPPARQALVIARVQTIMAAVALQTTIILGVATWLIWRGATGQSTEEVTMALLIAAVLTTPLLLGLFLPGIQRELERRISAHRTDPPSPNGNRRHR